MTAAASTGTALIAGATGLVGRHLLHELLASARYRAVVAVSRRAPPSAHEKLRAITVDFAQLEAMRDQLAAADVFCCLGTTIRTAGTREAFREVDYVYPLNLARATLARGAEQFALVSALGADPRSRIFYNHVKGETEEAIGALGFRSFLVFRPSVLVGARDERRPGETAAKVVLSMLRPVLVGPLERYRPIHARTVARAMARAAAQGVAGRRVFESETIERLGGSAGDTAA